MGGIPGNNCVRPVARRDRRTDFAVAGMVARLQAGDAPGPGQLRAEGTCPAAACQQARGLGPAASAAKLLGGRHDQSLIGASLENAGELGPAVGLAAELAVYGRTFFIQSPIIGPGSDQSVEIPEGLDPGPGRGAFAGAVGLEVQDLLRRAQPLRLLEIGRGLVELVRQGPRTGPGGATGSQSSGRAVIRRSRCQIAAKALPFCSASRSIGSCQAGPSSSCTAVGSRRPSCSKTLVPGRTVEPRDRQAHLHPQAGPGLDSQGQVALARVRKRLGNGPGARFAEVVDGRDRPAIGREYDLMNGMSHGPRRADRLRRGQVTEPDAPSSNPAATRPPSPRNAAQVAGDEEVRTLARTAPVVASRSLTVPSLPSVRKARPSGRNPPAASKCNGSPIGCPREVSHSRVELLPPASRGATIRPEFDSGDLDGAGQ